MLRVIIYATKRKVIINGLLIDRFQLRTCYTGLWYGIWHNDRHDIWKKTDEIQDLTGNMALARVVTPVRLTAWLICTMMMMLETPAESLLKSKREDFGWQDTAWDIQNRLKDTLLCGNHLKRGQSLTFIDQLRRDIEVNIAALVRTCIEYRNAWCALTARGDSTWWCIHYQSIV